MVMEEDEMINNKKGDDLILKNNEINKDTFSEKIILFSLGVLLGGVIATGSFFTYYKLININNNVNNNYQFQDRNNHDIFNREYSEQNMPNEQGDLSNRSRKQKNIFSEEKNTVEKNNDEKTK